jgi:hypothetical protein
VAPDELECIYEASGMLRAQVIRSKLEAFGIPSLLQYESAGPVFGITVDGLGAVRVMVPAHLAEEARSVIEELDEMDLEQQEDAP